MKYLALLVAFAGVAAANATLLYQNNIQTGARANPGSASHVFFDDVQIPTGLLGGNGFVDLTRVSVGIRQIAGDAGSLVDLWVGTGNGAGMLSTIQYIGTGSIGATATSRTVLLSATSGLPTGLALDFSSFAGKGTMFVGVGLASTASSIGWRITSGPDANADYFIDVDLGAMSQGAFYFGGSPVATFYAEVEGTPNPVPEPASLAVLGLGVLPFIRRRKV